MHIPPGGRATRVEALPLAASINQRKCASQAYDSLPYVRRNGWKSVRLVTYRPCRSAGCAAATQSAQHAARSIVHPYTIALAATLLGMDSRDLTKEQWRQLATDLVGPVGHFQKLINRMQELEFPKDDPLFDLVWKAQHAPSRVQSHANRTAHDLEWEAKHRGQWWREAQQP